MTNASDMAPIMYEGKEINTIHDLISNFKLDSFEEATRKSKQVVEDPENPVPGKKDIDQAYWDMIAQYRPSGAYY